jgi:hypothetical protein
MQTIAKPSCSRSLLVTVAVTLLSLTLSTGTVAQVSEASSTVAAVIPQQVRYTGTLPNRPGDIVEAVFKIYATAEGGEALWTETQRVSVSADGSYSVLLGAASQGGLPQTVFAAGQARWVGVTIDRAEESLRSPLSSVAYAMKAGDAESVGGLAAANLVTKDELAKLAQTVATTTVQAQPAIQPETTPTGSGTANYVPLWTASATLGNSNLFQAASGFMGIGTTTPGGPLQVSTGATGGANATMMLTQTSAASGNYYADIGLYNSHGLIGNLSALGAGYPAGQLFGPNDVVFLGGQQNAGTNLIFVTNTSGALKFGTGGYAKTNERLRISTTGGVSVGNSYVATDPGAGSMILSGKVGIGTTAPAAVLEVNGTAKFDGLITFDMGQTFPGTGTITAVTTTSPITGGGSSGSVAVGLNTSALEMTLDSVYAQLGGDNTFAGYTYFSDGITSSRAEGAGYTAVVGNGTNGSVGVSGTSDTGYGVVGMSNFGTGVYGVSTSGSSGVFAVNLTTDGLALSAEAGDGNAGVFSDDSAIDSTIYAENDSAGSSGYTPIVIEARSPGANAYGVYSFMIGNGGYGLYGESEGVATTGSGGRSAVGVKGVSTGDDSNGIIADATGTGGYGLYAHANGAFDTKRYAPAGVYALADTGIGVEGFAAGQSGTYNKFQTMSTMGGVWGDTSGDGSSGVAGGIVGTADDNAAGFFVNNSAGVATLYVHNKNSGGVTGLFKVFEASTPAGTCGIGDGDLSCTGQLKTLATTGGGARTVETYAPQSAENWMEDYGTGALARGAGVVQIDPTFADTVTADASYHVFLTPHGDSKGLYVTNLTATSFEVRESGGGTATLSFDYKIVGKRRGYEAQRMVDVTDRFNAEQAETKRRVPTGTALASKGVAEPQMVEHSASLARAAAARTHVKPAGSSVAPQAPVVHKSLGAPAKPVAKPM